MVALSAVMNCNTWLTDKSAADTGSYEVGERNMYTFCDIYRNNSNRKPLPNNSL
jgi:hypothetical protein